MFVHTRRRRRSYKYCNTYTRAADHFIIIVTTCVLLKVGTYTGAAIKKNETIRNINNTEMTDERPAAVKYGQSIKHINKSAITSV